MLWAGVDNGSHLVFLPIQMLAAPVAEGHEFPLHGCMASGTDVVTIPIREGHQFGYWHFLAVAEKQLQNFQPACRGMRRRTVGA